MKKIIFSAAMLTAAFASAQNTGIGTTKPNATLEVNGAAASTTSPDGVMMPKLTRAQLIAKTSYGASQTSAMVYVTDTSGTVDTATAKVTAPGYYYWDGNIWQKVLSENDAEWKYQTATNTIDLIKSGQAAGFTNIVKYNNATGQYLNYNSTTVESVNNGSTTTIPREFSGIKSYLQSDSKTMAPEQVKDSGGAVLYTRKTASFNELTLNENTQGTTLDASGLLGIVRTTKANNSSTNWLIGTYGGIFKNDNFSTAYITPGIFSANIYSGSVTGYASGVRSEINNTSSSTVNEINSLHSFTTIGSGSGQVSRAFGLNGATNFFASNTVPYSAGVEYTNYFWNNVNPSINELVGFRYKGAALAGGTTVPTNVVNHYGLVIDDVKNGQNNFAIYTRAGLSSFGDNLQIRNINSYTGGATDKVIVADTNGVLKSVDRSSFVGGSSNNIYTADGTLAGNRTVTMGTNNLYFTGAGKVGIGTTAPTAKLTVVAETTDPAEGSDITLQHYSTSSTIAPSPGINIFGSRGTAAAPVNIQNSDVVGSISIYGRINNAVNMTHNIQSRYTGNGTTRDSQFLISNYNGVILMADKDRNVGIGTETPSEKLDVSGSIKATSLAGTGIRNVSADSTGKLIVSSTSNIRTETASTTLAAADNGGFVYMNSSSAVTVTVPNIGTGFSCVVVQKGAGQVTFSGSGVTLQTARGTKTRTQFSAVGVIQDTTSTATITGDAIN